MKNNRKWTSDEESKLFRLKAQGDSFREIATKLGRSVKSIEHKLARTIQVSMPESPPAQTGLDPISDENPAEFWKFQASKLAKLLEEERWEKTVTQALVEEVRGIAPKSYETAPPISWPAKRDGTPQSAMLLLSDTHVGQVVEPEQTLGYGGYNIDVFLSRLKRLEQAIHSILSDHVTTPVDELVVGMLGDMIHGNLQHSVEAGQHHTLFEQFYAAGHALAQFMRNISTLAPKTRVYTTVGNHPRWGTQKKMPTDNRYSNLDQFFYAYTEALLRDCPSIEWHIDRQPFAVFDVQGYTFCCGHGDNLRGGDRALGIPAHSIGRHLGSSMGLRSQQHQPLVNYYCFGHLHRPIQLPHTLGEIIVNGGFPGVDGFGLSEGFQAYPPSQKFFLVHGRFGRTACYDLRLDFEPEGVAPFYILPKI